MKRLLQLLVLIGIGCSVWAFYVWYEQEKANRVLIEKIKDEVEQSYASDRAVRSAKSAEETGSVWADMHKKTRNSVVQVFAYAAQFNWLEPYKTPAQKQGRGTAFFIDDNGTLLTNAHVVDQAKALSIQIPVLGKRRFDVDIVGVSPDRDLALLRVRPDDLETLHNELGDIAYLQLGDSDQVHGADEIMALGYPLGQESLKSTTGVVSGREHIDGRYMIQISAPINPGSSGGPSLARNTEVMGVNTSGIMPSQSVGYIIPSNEVKIFLHQLEEMEPAEDDIKILRKPFLGVIFNNATPDMARFLGNPLPGGLYVVQAYKGSPLWKADVRSGDMMYEINGHRIDQFGEMNVAWSEDKVSVANYVARLVPGEEIHLVIYRNGKRMEKTTTFDYSELAPIRFMHPAYEYIPYEVIGGMVIMPLTLNHLPHFVQKTPQLTRYVELKHQMEPALLISHVLPDSAASRTRALQPGSIIQEVNEKPVHTLSEFRDAVKAHADSDYLTVKTTEDIFAVLPLKKIFEEEKKLARTYFFNVSPFVKDLMTSTSDE
jgi:serine protease Do